MQGVWVGSLFGEQRSHMPLGQKKTKQKAEKILLPNSIKTFKTVHIGKQILRKKKLEAWKCEGEGRHVVVLKLFPWWKK